MPVMKPSTSLLNFTPSSYSPESAALALAGTADDFQRLVHGHSPTMIETVMPDPTDSTLPLSSIALVWMVAVPSDARRPLQRPRRRARRLLPRRAAVDRHLDAADRAAAIVDSGAADRHAIAAFDGAVVRRGRDGRRGREDVRGLRAGHQRTRRVGARLQRRGLRAHVGKQIDGGLLHGLIGRCASRANRVVVVTIEPPRPLHGACAEHQRAAVVAVERQVCVAGADADVRAEVDDLLDVVNVVDDRRTSPAGRKPLSSASPHS